MHVLALEPYYGGSHRQFVDGLARHSRHRFTVRALPARKWKWRMRGAALWFADQLAADSPEDPELIFTCDMLAVADLRSLLPPPLAGLPLVCYFHENQLTYPLEDEVERDYQYGFTNITSALAADAVWFNSAYHRDQFLAAAGGLLAKMPDFVPADVVARIEGKSAVLHPGISLEKAVSADESGPLANRWRAGDTPTVVWNHRWEYDKNPEAFFAAMQQLADRGVPYRLVVAGERFRTAPAIFAEAATRLADRIAHWGYAADRREYEALLAASDVVISTARHEFFGIAVLEAVAAGCMPLLPRRLAYPELIPQAGHEPVLYDDEAQIVSRLAEWFTSPAAWAAVASARRGLASHAQSFLWSRRAEAFDAALESMIR